MLFNSLQFILFFIIITISYWKLPHRFRWLLLLLASCYFYMVFEPVYILILGFTIVIDYIAGIYLEKIETKQAKKIFLIFSLIANIGVLAVFKYYNFISLNLDKILRTLGDHTPLPMLDILLPIGLSFHTFQAMSYTIEVYRGNQKAEKHFGIYALYVMFYPQLVAGPIERPQNILHQFHSRFEYNFENVKSGLMQMAFGMFKKIVIADRLAILVDAVYASPAEQSGLSVVVACIFYSFQIYCDFSGYCDIGIGAARVMGFKLMENFHMPYFSKTISEFWARWHISLSTWFRDYLYIPLGGNRVNTGRWFVNLFVVFLISGLWHGASWTFIIWGAVHGTFLIAGILKIKLFKMVNHTPKDDLITNTLRMISTFILVCFAWIFFRSGDMVTARRIIGKLFSVSMSDSINAASGPVATIFCFLLIVLLLLKERFWFTIPTRSTRVFYINFVALILLCYFFGVFNHKQFIYFQF